MVTVHITDSLGGLGLSDPLFLSAGSFTFSCFRFSIGVPPGLSLVSLRYFDIAESLVCYTKQTLTNHDGVNNNTEENIFCVIPSVAATGFN